MTHMGVTLHNQGFFPHSSQAHFGDPNIPTLFLFLKCLMKIGRYQARLFNSVLISDQYLKPLKKRRKNIFPFECSSCSMMRLRNNFLDRDDH